jgi:hypothetical protein
LTGPSNPTLKRLFAMSHNLCAFLDCTEPLVEGETVVGEVCHIKGEKPGSARYDADQTDAERHEYGNLIAMCRKHHRVIDNEEAKYPVEKLLQMKEEHAENDSRRYVISDKLVQRLGEMLATEATGGPPHARGPTLEATNKSVIDASGAAIPGDLPFQFARADNNSLIAMPGVQVTKTGNGWQITPGNANLQFPAAPMRFALMSTLELKRQLRDTAHNLRHIQDQFTAEIGRAVPDRTNVSEVFKKYTEMYEDKFSSLAFSLASAALPRIGMLSTIPRKAASGGQLLYYKRFHGPAPAGDIAAFLDLLSDQLPPG